MSGLASAVASGYRSSVHRARLERRQDVFATEFLASVKDVRAHCADGQRPFVNRRELTPLAKVDGDGDHFRVVLLTQPGDGDRRVEATRVGEKDSFHVFQISVSQVSVRSATNLSATARAASGARQITRIVSSPAIVPTISACRDRSIATARVCA